MDMINQRRRQGNSALRAMIVDDEEPSRRRLRIVLADCFDLIHNEVVGESRNGREAVDMSMDLRPDVVLMDINMPKMNGIEAARHINKMASPPAIIFTTAYDEYALDAFSVHAIDYLMKPVRREHLAASLRRASAFSAGQLALLAESQSGARTHFSISRGRKLILVPVEDVTHLKAEEKYVIVHTKDGAYEIEEALANLEREFPRRFVRIHRNCLIARDCLSGFERMRNGAWGAVLRGLTEILPVSRRQGRVVQNLKDMGER